MKTLVHAKNKVLLGGKKSTDDADFTALKGHYQSKVAQQKVVFKNMVRQDAGLKQISLGVLGEHLRKGGCENDPLYPAYAEAFRKIDKLLADYSVCPISTLFQFHHILNAQYLPPPLTLKTLGSSTRATY
jgi:hypothetical protein